MRADLLFEVTPLLLVHQYQVEVIANRELFIDVPHRRRQFIAAEEEADWNGLA